MALLLLLLTLLPPTTAHGIVTLLRTPTTTYPGYSPSYQYTPTPPLTPSWSIPLDKTTGFIAPTSYDNPDIICHLSALPSNTSLPVAAGTTIALQWTPWPPGHHGPVLDYLAACNGPCDLAAKTSLQFTKIAEMGLVNSTVNGPGVWASDMLIAANNTWNVTLPRGLKAGSYVLRHEIIALHSANDENGAQNYPQCVNLEVTDDGTHGGNGTQELSGGTAGTALYDPGSPGVKINIYTSLSAYRIPGPSVWSGATALSHDGGTAATTGMTATTFTIETFTSTSTSSPISISVSSSTTTITSAPDPTSSAEIQATDVPTTTVSAASDPSSKSTVDELVAWLDILVASLMTDAEDDGDGGTGEKPEEGARGKKRTGAVQEMSA